MIDTTRTHMVYLKGRSSSSVGMLRYERKRKNICSSEKMKGM